MFKDIGFFFFPPKIYFYPPLESVFKVLGKVLEKSENVLEKVLEKLKGTIFRRQEAKCEGKGVRNAVLLGIPRRALTPPCTEVLYLDLHGAGSQGSDFLLHAISNPRVHGGTSR